MLTPFGTSLRLTEPPFENVAGNEVRVPFELTPSRKRDPTNTLPKLPSPSADSTTSMSGSMGAWKLLGPPPPSLKCATGREKLEYARMDQARIAASGGAQLAPHLQVAGNRCPNHGTTSKIDTGCTMVAQQLQPR